ncbi:MAG: hypothetical protein IJW40_01385 [Clostridia bacterium]|nr:hypothetical protein [Clostridia bacterium]
MRQKNKNGCQSMPQWLRLCCLICAMLLISVLAVACTDDAPDDGEQLPADDEQTADQDEAIDLSKYTLIRADGAGSDLRTSFGNIRTVIKDICGAELVVGTDYVDKYVNARTEYEIIVGHTNIPEENIYYEKLSEGEYIIAVEGTKIIVVGYSEEDTLYAIDRFLEMTVGYNADHYENPKRENALVTVTYEEGKTVGQLLESGRVIEEIEECWSDPINPAKSFASGGYTLSDGEIVFTRTDGAYWNGKTEDGSYRVQITVENRGTAAPIVQLMCNMGNGVEHICLSVEGNFVRFVRGTYERGGAHFSGDVNNYTLRVDVHPEAGRALYYVDGVFLGEMNIGNGDSPLIENTGVRICGVGNDIEVAIKDIYIENIDTIDARRYDAPDIEIKDEEVYPKSQNAPAKTIYVIDGMTLSARDFLTATTLQGLVNRTTPEIFIDYRAYNQDPRYSNIDDEVEYLELLEAKGRTLVKTTLDELLVRFADRYDGVIVGDCLATTYNENVATSLAGVLDGVYMTEERYDKMKDEIKKDILFRLDDRFASSIDAYMWLWNTYGDRFSRTVLFHLPSDAESAGHVTRACRDYAVMSRAFTFWTTDVVTLEDYDFYMSIFAACAPNTPVIGSGNGNCCFPEFEMFQICGQFAKYFTYGFSTPNMSLFNSLEVGALKQKEPAEAVSLTEDTVYVTFDISEGDNLSWDYHLWMHNFADEKARANIAKGYSFCGALYYVAPAILENYYAKATPNDYFFMDGGGISNLSSPDDFGILYNEDDREAIVDRMLELTEYVASKTDTQVLRSLHNISDEMGERYANECPSLTALFSSYGNMTVAMGGTNKYTDAVYMVDDIVRCRSYLTTFQGDLKPQLQGLLNQARNTEDGIVFAKVFVYANQMLDDVSVLETFREQLEAGTDKNVVIVRPDVFAQLYAEYAS